MNLEFDDPLEPFRDAFSRLLGPKRLVRADLQQQQLIYEHEGTELAITTLSSGEREVLNITFDFILRKPSDCIVFFDEPELHLHPELLGRLISTLRAVGERNQFILISHSPEVISSSLDDTVVFLTPPKEDKSNQAVVIGRDDEATEVLNRLGQSIGVVSLGKKIVLIEGRDASLDKQTYSHLLKNRFPNLVLLSSGGKGNLQSFSTVQEEVLNRSIWGVNFYILADRDAAPNIVTPSARFRTLPRYHLENYFLDPDVLANCFADMEPVGSWLRSPDEIENKLKQLASECLPYAVSLVVSDAFRQKAGNISIMPKGVSTVTNKSELILALSNLAADEAARIEDSLRVDSVAQKTSEVFEKLELLLGQNDGRWKYEFPAKSIFSRFCNAAKINEGRLKSLYLVKAEMMAAHPMAEIIDIFSHFSTHD